jgi:hypothetical protein
MSGAKILSRETGYAHRVSSAAALDKYRQFNAETICGPLHEV